MIISKEQFDKKAFIKKLLHENLVFIYPTDTIYGLGCNANNESAVRRIREIKERSKNPFSIIAPSKEWIDENCIVNENARSWIKRLPGPYTLIFKVKDQSFSKEVNPGIDSIGIRMPDHWFMAIAKEAKVPIVSTSANKSNQHYMTSLENLDEGIKDSVDMIIYEGKKQSNPSTIVDLTDSHKVTEQRRK